MWAARSPLLRRFLPGLNNLRGICRGRVAVGLHLRPAAVPLQSCTMCLRATGIILRGVFSRLKLKKLVYFYNHFSACKAQR